MAFQFPASPAPYASIVNDITGSTYQWRPDLTKWVIISSPTSGSDIVWEGDSPPDPIGDYKLWYSTDTLELYFYYCDTNGVCAWLPTSVPIQVLEDLNAFAAEAEVDISQLQYKQQLLQNTLDQIYLEQNNVKNDIIELEEEIDALAPSVERGSWRMTLSGQTSSRGQLTMYNDIFGQGSPIGVFKQVKSVWFHEEDISGTPHGFSNVEPGYLLELFVEGESDYGLFEVVEVHDETSPPTPYYAIDVNFIRALSDTAKADNSDLVRMKTFQAPTGGDAGEFVLKSGDEMSGNLKFKSTNSFGDILGTNAATAKIVFENTDSNGGKKSLSLFQTGTSNELKTTASFRAGNMLSSGMYYGCSDGGGFHNPIVNLTSNEGQLRWSTQNQLTWDATGITANTPIELSADGFATEDEHVVHKGYVDEQLEGISSLIQVLPGNPSNPQVGDAWFSTNQNVFIIKIS